MIHQAPHNIDFLCTQRLVPALSSEAQRKGKANYEALPSPRIMRSHSLYSSRFPKVVYLLRDGRDALVSYYYHFRKFHGFVGGLHDFIQTIFRSQQQWSQHVDSWLFLNPSLSNLHVVRYEDLLRDPFPQIDALLKFIGLSRTPRQIHRALEASTFDKMRHIEVTKGLGYVSEGNRQLYFVRKGKSGSWRDEFGPDEKDLVKTMYGTALIKTGYEKSFHW